MKITNTGGEPLIGLGVDEERGFGDDVIIAPGETIEVYGPYLGEMDGGKCFIHIEGSIVCQETPDDEHGFQVIPGHPLRLRCQDHQKGINVRHYLDDPEPDIVAFRSGHLIFSVAHSVHKESREQKKLANEASREETYCVDIRVGYDEGDREDLIEFLKRRGEIFPGMSAERGMWQGVKILRVYTTNGENLVQHVIAEHRLGDDFDYEVHLTPIDEQRCMTYLSDYDTAFSSEKFDL